MSNVKVGAVNFLEEVLKSAGPVVVIFSTEGCPPRKAIAPFLEEIATELAGKVKIIKLDIVGGPHGTLRYWISEALASLRT